MIRYLLKRFRKSERGAALIEFAIAIPVLLLLVFGIIEFGWILSGHITLTGAVREGARIAIVSDHSDKSSADIKKEAKQAVIMHAKTFQLLEEDIEVHLGDYKSETTVEISEAKLPLIVGILPFVGNTYVIKDVRVTMMHE